MPSFDALESLKLNLADIQEGEPPYIRCNEQYQAETIAKLKEHFQSSSSSSKPGVHIGFSVWFNLDILAVSPAQYAIILDYDPMVSIVYQKIQDAFQSCSTRQEFIKNLVDNLNSDDRGLLGFPLEYEQDLFDKMLTNEYGFLSEDASYDRVKKMSDEGRIFFGCADMCSEKHLKLISDWCGDNNAEIKTLYLSNIPEWVKQKNSSNPEIFNDVIDNLKVLVESHTQVIDAFYPTAVKKGSGPPLRITQGALPQFSIPKVLNNLNRQFSRGSWPESESGSDSDASLDERLARASKKPR